MYQITDEVEKEIAYLEKIIAKADDNLKSVPEGTLHIQKNEKTNKYYRLRGKRESKDAAKTGKRDYLIMKRDKDLIRALAQKAYDLNVRKTAEKQLNKLQSILKTYHPDSLREVYEKLSPERKELINNYVFCPEVYIKKWQEAPYRPKTIDSKDAQYTTDRGEIVRSKSERMIANYYNKMGIPYKYECPITINGITIYPDFTVLNKRTGKKYYHEHFGVLTDAEYVEDCVVRKIRTYRKAGIVLGENFFMTGEIGHQTFNIQDLEFYVQRYLL